MGVSRKDRPHFARWGGFPKGAVKSQRWGRNAKTEVGSKRKDESGVKTQMEFYDFDTLQRIALDRGYTTTRALADALQPIFDKERYWIVTKLKEGNLTKEQCEVIGSLLEMTPKEYYETFMKGFFKQTQNGRFICDVEDPVYHVQFSNKNPLWKRQEQKRKERQQQIMEQIEKL